MNGIAKKKWFVPLILFLLVIIAVSAFTDEKNSQSYQTLSTEERLRDMCNLVKGVSNAEVMICYEAREVSNIIGYSTGKEKISGIAIVCDGGDNPDVRLALYEMVNALFDIKSTRITVSDRN